LHDIQNPVYSINITLDNDSDISDNTRSNSVSKKISNDTISKLSSINSQSIVKMDSYNSDIEIKKPNNDK